VIGYLGDAFANARFINVQANDKGTHNLYVVPLDAPHGGTEVPVLQRAEIFAKFPEPFGPGGLKLWINNAPG
jgi:hypothetical protein